MTDEDEAALLPQLEQILAFVGQLEQVDVSWVDLQTVSLEDVQHVTRSGVVDSAFSEKFLSNINHTITNQSVVITGELSEH